MGYDLEKNYIAFNDWNKGIGASPEVGFADMRNVDISSIPGTVMVNKKTLPAYTPEFSTNFTADSSTDKITLSHSIDFSFGTGDSNGTGAAITLSTNDTLPAPLAVDTTYFLIHISGLEYKLASFYDNATRSTPIPINITDNGTGAYSLSARDIGLVKHFSENKELSILPFSYTKTNQDIYGLDDNGVLWRFDGFDNPPQPISGNTGTSAPTTWARGNGLVVWKGYVFVFRDVAIDVYDIENDTWDNSWQALNTPADFYGNTTHYAIVAQDDAIYFCDGRYIGSIIEDTTFNPSDAGTYTYNNQALDLPENENARYLTEAGGNLVIGTDINKIYLWDTTSSTFELPVVLDEENVASMVTVGNLVYVFAGVSGKISVTDGVSVEEAGQVPEHITGAFENNEVTFGGSTRVGNKLVFGVKTTNTNGAGGIWSYNLKTKAIVLENKITKDVYGNGTVNVEVPAIIRYDNDRYYASWQGGTSSVYDGVDLLSEDTRYDNYETVIDSDYAKLGTPKNPERISHIEVELTKELGTNEALRIYYRVNQTDSFTLLDTIDDTGEKSFDIDAGIDAESIQFRIALKSSAESNKVNVPLKNFVAYFD